MGRQCKKQRSSQRGMGFRGGDDYICKVEMEERRNTPELRMARQMKRAQERWVGQTLKGE